jgi:Tfp pilus assembly protein PilF
MSDRLAQLLKMLEREPRDTFLLYGIALEHKKVGDAPRAIEFLDKVIAIDPGYCYAYHQKGLVHESAGDTESAKGAYRDGVAAAQKKGDEHARQEIATALEMLG